MLRRLLIVEIGTLDGGFRNCHVSVEETWLGKSSKHLPQPPDLAEEIMSISQATEVASANCFVGHGNLDGLSRQSKSSVPAVCCRLRLQCLQTTTSYFRSASSSFGGRFRRSSPLPRHMHGYELWKFNKQYLRP